MRELALALADSSVSRAPDTWTPIAVTLARLWEGLRGVKRVGRRRLDLTVMLRAG